MTESDLKSKKEWYSAAPVFPHKTQLDPSLMSSLLVNLHKALDSISQFLTMPLTKKKRPQMMPETVDKTVLTILSEMATKESPENAAKWLSTIGISLFYFCEVIHNSKTDVTTILERFLKEYKSDKGASLFSISPSTLNRAFDQIPQKNVDDLLSQQLTQIEARLHKQGLQPKEAMLAIDPSDHNYSGKYHNQYTPWGFTGQKETYKRGFKENMIYVNPSAFIESLNLQIVQPEKRCERDIPLWVIQTQQAIHQEKERGTVIKLIEGDREFYKAIGFAYSRFGLWNPKISPEDNPRFLCPKKSWEQPDLKMNFLLDPAAKEVIEDKISLDHYQKKFLESILPKLSSNTLGTKIEIPFITIAVFDSYPNGHRQETLTWAHTQAIKIATKLKDLEEELILREKDYTDYLNQQKKKSKKNGKKKSNTRKVNPPKYEGKRRSKFKEPLEKELYKKCCEQYDLIQVWKHKKTKLVKRLMFFNLSLYEGESIVDKEEELIAFIRQYHERWAIENGFKAIKYHFFLKTNSRGACARHARWILSCLVYNAWHYWRLVRATRVIKRSNPEWVLFDTSFSPPIRQKFERKMKGLLTAQGYLLDELLNGIKMRIKKVVSTLF